MAFGVGERYGDAAFDCFASRDEVAGLKNRIGGVCGEFGERRALFLHEIARLWRLFVHGFHPEADAVEEQQRFAFEMLELQPGMKGERARRRQREKEILVPAFFGMEDVRILGRCMRDGKLICAILELRKEVGVVLHVGGKRHALEYVVQKRCQNDLRQGRAEGDGNGAQTAFVGAQALRHVGGLL